MAVVEVVLTVAVHLAAAVLALLRFSLRRH